MNKNDYSALISQAEKKGERFTAGVLKSGSHFYYVERTGDGWYIEPANGAGVNPIYGGKKYGRRKRKV